jgi:hypothetical protein
MSDLLTMRNKANFPGAEIACPALARAGLLRCPQ